MVRVKGKDDLSDVAGKISTAFRSINLTELHLHFSAVANKTDTKSTARVLGEFYRAANKLCSSEKEFNKRARPSAASRTPSLMHNLRSPEHLAALRSFNVAKTKLLEINEEIGQQIIHLTENEITAAAHAPARNNARL